MAWIKKHKILTGIGVFILLIVIGAAFGGSSSKKTTSSATQPAATKAAAAPAKTVTAAPTHTKNSEPFQHAEDAVVTGCKADSVLHYPTATVKVINNSSKTSDYMVTVAFQSRDGKTQIDTGTVFVNGLNAGQSTTQTAQALTEAQTTFKCVVTDVTRTASS